MHKSNQVNQVLEEYNQGKRHFTNLDLDNESFDELHLEGIIFENCFIGSSFRKTNLRNARFISSNIKTCDFSNADLTNAHFENLSVEAAIFKGALIDGIVFNNNWCYGQLLVQADFEAFKNNSLNSLE